MVDYLRIYVYLSNRDNGIIFPESSQLDFARYLGMQQLFHGIIAQVGEKSLYI